MWLQHFRTKGAERGVKKAHEKAVNQAQVRRPLAWKRTRVMGESIGEWG